jgi:hypothetical protein
VSQAEYDQWKPSFDNAASSLKNREELLAESYAALENNFTYLGVTAIEDKLQEGVPEVRRLYAPLVLPGFSLTLLPSCRQL